jgi:Signal transduction histidine kinase
MIPCGKRAAVAAGIWLALASAAWGQDKVTAEQVVAFVDRMLAHIEAVGEEKAFADFSDIKGPWIQGELYPFCHNLAGVNVAHGGNPNMVGKGGVLDIRDPDGLYVNRLIFEKVLAEGKGWVEYKWPNSITKKIEMKDVYSVLVHGKYICGSGRYK